MKINQQVALVTGAGRGIGREFVLELLERGARKVYVAVRDPENIHYADDRVLPLRLDLLDSDTVEDAAKIAGDVTLLVNNAGVSTGASLISGELRDLHLEMDTHYWGTLGVIREFAPVLARNGGGAIVNILSALAWFSMSGAGGYAAAKAAAWNMTNAIRLELASQGTLVQSVLFGVARTEMMTEAYTGPAIDPREVPRQSLNGLETGAIEVIVDDTTAWVKAALAGDRAEFYAQLEEKLGMS